MCLISVIVPVYNSEKYVGRCLDSIINQEYKNLEIIVIDDGSTDSSPEICRKYELSDSRITLYRQNNQGLSSARNSGMREAHGDYIGFVDSDDWLEKDFYSTLLKIAIENNADLVSSTYKIVKKAVNKRKESKYVLKVAHEDDILCYYLESAIAGKASHVTCCTKIYRRDVIQQYEFEYGCEYEDILFNWRVMMNAEVCAYTDYYGYNYFCNPQSITRTKKKFDNKDYDLLHEIQSCKKEYYESNRIHLNSIISLLDTYISRGHYSLLVKQLRKRGAKVQEIDSEHRKVKMNFVRLISSKMSLKRKMVLVVFFIIPVGALSALFGET